MRVKTPLRATITVTALALALAGCGSKADTPQSSAPGQSVEHTDDISAGVQPDPAAVKLLPEAVKAKGKISVAMDLSSPPTTFLAKDNKTPIGFNPDMARLIAAKLGVKLQVDNVKFDTIIPGLQGGRFDFTATTMGATAERLKVLDMINYFQNGTGVAVPRGNPQKLSVHDLCGRRVGVQSGTTAELKWLPQLSEKDCTSQGKPAIAGVTLPSVNDALTQLASKRLDAVMYDFTSLAWAAKRQPNVMEVLQERVITAKVNVALPKGSPLTPAIKVAVQSIIDSPKYAEALDRWGFQGLGIESAAMAVPLGQ
ncbi:ABC transporter substrate-binding protein [Lentzea sp. PSKA42]|uniref:ABC transporter substrate-binding protein n=1 Tax=Lentzea indica TaxID=2604800 RepID=A0ABX1FLK6_9PSEU|nr:ABC transporter substrate-binding protein [Lentzea indica]NKE59883.1 ABC transporter substrate-binding protein [Lentzea indica]